MANRLTRIYTRTGDEGTTSLGDGTRSTKESTRIEAIGTVNSTVASEYYLQRILRQEYTISWKIFSMTCLI